MVGGREESAAGVGEKGGEETGLWTGLSTAEAT